MSTNTAVPAGESGNVVGGGAHQEQVLAYLRFVRLKRTQFLRDISLTFQEMRDKHVQEATYSQDEVLQITQDLERLTKGDMEQELIHLAHTNVLLLQQYFAQAENCKLKLTANLGQLENRTLMDAVAKLEDGEFSLKTKATPSKLAPLVDAGTLSVFHQEIDRLKLENAKLKVNPGASQPLAVPNTEAGSKMEKELALLQSKVNALESDLRGKLQASKPVQAMHRILSKKNEALKAMRAHLLKVDPKFDMSSVMAALQDNGDSGAPAATGEEDDL